MLTRLQGIKLPSSNLVAAKTKRFACTNLNCGKTFKHARSLKFHIDHLCNRPHRFKCSHCLYTSSRHHSMRNHINLRHENSGAQIIELIKTNEVVKPFVCPKDNCNKNYTCIRNLREHLKYECGKPPSFKCAYCSFIHCLKKRVNFHCRHKHPNCELRVYNI